jgi:glycosyltransferase involved in cell wall biosynthesis
LQEKNINFSAQIAGGIAPNLQDEIGKILKKLSATTKYLGIIKGQDKKSALQNSNVFILPTLFIEGQPLSILEAMATGNIILTTNSEGIADIFEENKNGFYINKKDPEDIAKKLISISQNLPSYQNIMLYNRENAGQKYQVKTFINNFIKILES